jgi:hypothetical protein
MDLVGRLERSTSPVHPLNRLLLEDLELVDDRLALLVEMVPLEPAQPCGAARYEVLVVVQPPWRRRERAIRAGVHRTSVRCE